MSAKRWPVHKLQCKNILNSSNLKLESNHVITNIDEGNSKSFKNLKVVHLKIDEVPPDFLNTRNFSSKSVQLVGDGQMKCSKDFLFAWGVITCAFLIVWGQSEVFLLHLSGWNAPGNPMEKECIDIASKLPSEFKFVKGVIMPGQSVDSNLYWGDKQILNSLMTNEVLKNISWRNQLQIITGLRACHVIVASVKDSKLTVFKSPGVSDSDGCPIN